MIKSVKKISGDFMVHSDQGVALVPKDTAIGILRFHGVSEKDIACLFFDLRYAPQNAQALFGIKGSYICVKEAA